MKKPSTKTTSVSSAKSVHTSAAATAAANNTPGEPSSPAPAPQSLAARVIAAVEHITQAKTLLGLDTPLSAKQIKRAVKFKKGGEPHVATLADLSARYGVEVPSRPTADMTASLDLASQLVPARAAIDELSKTVEDAYFGARSDTWATATSLYSMLKKGAAHEPALASALAPLQEYFAYRHPTVAANHPKRAPAKAVDRAQAKAAKRLAKLRAEVTQLEAAMPAEPPPVAETPAPAPAVSAPTTH